MDLNNRKFIDLTLHYARDTRTELIMTNSAVFTLIALVLLIGIAVFLLPASIRHHRQTDDGRFDPPLHRFDDYDDEPYPGKPRKGRAGNAGSSGFFGFTGDGGGTSSTDCSSSGGGGDGGGCG